MSFRVTGLSPEPFRRFFGLSAEALAVHGIVRVVVDAHPGYPDRIEMRDAAVGETLLLLNHEYQPAATPYRGRHAVYVREGAEITYDRVDEIPEVMRRRLLSVRAFDGRDMMIDADVVDGGDLETVIERMFAAPEVAYLHVHFAKRGCFSGRVDRVAVAIREGAD